MKKSEKFTLVKGKYNPSDAKEILGSLFNNKISYHTLKNFSYNIRLGKTNQEVDEQISVLQNSREQLLNFLEEAHSKGLELEIDSTIKINIG